MTTFSLWRLVRFPRQTGLQQIGSRQTGRKRIHLAYSSVLSIIAFGVATSILLTVGGGLHAFISRAQASQWGEASLGQKPTFEQVMASMTPIYVILAAFATALLIIPICVLAGEAARLAASRRDSELAALRLAGATSGQTLRLAAFDSTAQAACGALIGIVGYFVLIPVIMLIHFQNSTFTFAELWVGPLALVVSFVAVTVIALVSSLTSLRKVAISPLGVSMRTQAGKAGKWRIAVAGVGAVIAFLIIKFAGQTARDTLALVLTVTIPILIVFALINLAGPAVVRHSAKQGLKKTSGPMASVSGLLACRRILDNPKRAWRNVSGVALAVFVTVVCCVCSAFEASGGVSDPQAHATAVFSSDIRTGGFLTLVFAAVLAAVSSGVMQAGNVYDQQNEYRELIVEGADGSVLDRARRMEAFRPLRAVTIVSLCCAILPVFPVVGSTLLKPASLLTLVGGIGICFALVWLGCKGADRAAARLGVRPVRQDD
jgi:hypothetical protein